MAPKIARFYRPGKTTSTRSVKAVGRSSLYYSAGELTFIRDLFFRLCVRARVA
ncbi:hypothetical protein FRUB_05446 [Fimbriiglobus ruber]|uniref:Uncharacterized protein n=1 Tax=Fimbriiglobus ruber TaxID=1908690 RepID=A0A225DWF1_9BACT|nr:hypothetical protein FRUB_05446 [Fimbriiglobus ruber]